MSLHGNAAPLSKARRQQQRAVAGNMISLARGRGLSLRSAHAISDGEPHDDVDTRDHQQRRLRAARRERFSVVWDHELDTQPDQTWLVDGALPENGFGVLFGQSGLYKTFIALDLSYRIAAGLSWGGRSVRQGTVLYVAAEGSIAALKKRARAWRLANNIAGAPVAFLPHSIVLDPKSGDVDQLIDMIDRMDPQPVMVVIDTIARCMSGDENSTRDMGEYVRAADIIRERTGAFVLHVHHTLKKDPLTERGASALRGAADVMLQVARRGGRIELSCDKQRDDSDDWAYTVSPIPVAEANSVAVALVSQEKAAPGVNLGVLARKAYDALVRLSRPATFAEWQDAAAPDDSNFSKKISKLLDAGMVTKGVGKSGRYTAVAAVISQSRPSDDCKPNSHSHQQSPLKGDDCMTPTEGKQKKRRDRSSARRVVH